MAFIIYGIKQLYIGGDDIMTRCASCEKHSWAEMNVVGKYFHFFWIPFFPVDKEVNITCEECGLKRNGLYFSESVIPNFREVKHKFRQPLYSYTGLIIIGLVIISVIIF